MTPAVPGSEWLLVSRECLWSSQLRPKCGGRAGRGGGVTACPLLGGLSVARPLKPWSPPDTRGAQHRHGAGMLGSRAGASGKDTGLGVWGREGHGHWLPRRARSALWWSEEVRPGAAFPPAAALGALHTPRASHRQGQKGRLAAGYFQGLRGKQLPLPFWAPQAPAQVRRGSGCRSGAGGPGQQRQLSWDTRTFGERMSPPSLEASKPRLGTYLAELGLLEGEPWAQGGGSSLAPGSNVPTLCVRAREERPTCPVHKKGAGVLAVGGVYHPDSRGDSCFSYLTRQAEGWGGEVSLDLGQVRPPISPTSTALSPGPQTALSLSCSRRDRS